MDNKVSTANKGFINATAMKFIAIIAMTIDHYAWLFPNPDLKFFAGMHFIGRLTAPLMCFFITEGYHHTSNLKRYFTRMMIFALISQAPFMLFYKTAFGVMNQASMITTLLLCLLSVHIINSEQFDRAFKLPALLLLTLVAQLCDWGANAIYFTLAFELGRNSSRLRQIAGYVAVCVFAEFNVIKVLVTSFSENWYMIYNFGVLLPAVVLMFYNGKRGGSKSPVLKKASKYFFYIYYPLHIVILSLIRIKMDKG